MAELSKTAAAAMKAVERSNRKEAVILTPEQQVKAAKELRQAKLFVPPHMIDTLLIEYDRLAGVVEQYQTAKSAEIPFDFSKIEQETFERIIK